MARYEDWPKRLQDYIAERRAQPFAYGTNDCCQFARGAAIAITGQDPMALVSSYKTATRAKVLQGRLGASLEEAVESVLGGLGYEAVSPAFAQRGDIVLAEVPSDGGLMPATGIVDFCGTRALFVGQNGLCSLPVSKCLQAWRVE